MEFDAFHHWLMLRSLIVFVMALPLLIAILLAGRHQKRREKDMLEDGLPAKAGIIRVHEPTASQIAEVKPEPAKATAAVSAVADRQGDSRVAAGEAPGSALAMPREWDGGPLRPNWNRQVRLGGGRSSGGLR